MDGVLIEDGQLFRCETMQRAGRKILVSLMRRAYVPHAYRFDLEVIAGEALSNAYKFHQNALDGTGGGWVGYYMVAGPSHLMMVFAYATPEFDPDAPTPAVVAAQGGACALLKLSLADAVHGRGIQIMRDLSDAICFTQGAGGLVLSVEKRWPA